MTIASMLRDSEWSPWTSQTSKGPHQEGEPPPLCRLASVVLWDVAIIDCCCGKQGNTVAALPAPVLLQCSCCLSEVKQVHVTSR